MYSPHYCIQNGGGNALQYGFVVDCRFAASFLVRLFGPSTACYRAVWTELRNRTSYNLVFMSSMFVLPVKWDACIDVTVLSGYKISDGTTLGLGPELTKYPTG